MYIPSAVYFGRGVRCRVFRAGIPMPCVSNGNSDAVYFGRGVRRMFFGRGCRRHVSGRGFRRVCFGRGVRRRVYPRCRVCRAGSPAPCVSGGESGAAYFANAGFETSPDICSEMIFRVVRRTEADTGGSSGHFSVVRGSRWSTEESVDSEDSGGHQRAFVELHGTRCVRVEAGGCLRRQAGRQSISQNSEDSDGG